MAGMPVGYADRGERGRCDQVGESSVIIVADDRVRALVREVAGGDAVIVAADEVRRGQRVDLVVEGGRRRSAPAVSGPPRLVLDALGGCDRERLVWCLDMGRGLDGGLVADRCRVAALRAEEIAEHLRVRARSSLGKAAWHMRRRVRGTADRREHMPRGAGALPVDTATDDPPLPERPSVSVVVPTRDGPELLAQILAGLARHREVAVIEDRAEAIATAIAEARAHGDLSENAEYHAAKEAQGLNEAKVADLEDKLSRAQIIDPRELSGDKIVFGATVTLLDEDDKSVKYQIVGQAEADVKTGRISYNSPIGRALIGKSVGDEVEVTVPAGDRWYEVSKIEFI